MKLSEAVSILKAAGICDAKREARLIFSHFGSFSLAELVCGDVSSHNPRVSDAIARRAQREPLQYVIGEVGFYNELYKISSDCLIPRSDTELLVEYAARHVKEGDNLLDLCTGSGCVAISTLKNTKSTRATAVDLSHGTLDLARENARLNGVYDRIDFIEGDACDVSVASSLGTFDAILSNPPYVSDSAYLTLEPEIFHEPKMAFVAGDDGADFYRALTPIYKSHLNPDGFIAYEIGCDQKELIMRIARDNGMSVEILYDLSSNPRVAVLKNISSR